MTREYFLRIEEVSWNYAPSGMNIIQNITLQEDEEASVFLKRGPQRIGSTYKKAVYKQYSDATYRTEVMKAEWMGILGPLLMAEEGDTVFVHLKNAATRPYSIHPHGLNYSKGNEGALYPDGPVLRAEEKDTIKVVFKNKASRPYSIQPHGVQYSIEQDGTLYHNELEESYTAKKLRELKREPRVVTPSPAAHVLPGTLHTYEWMVPLGAGPVQGEADCLTYLYYSGVDPVKDTQSGLVGPLLVCRPGSLKRGIQKNYNKEFHLMATMFDENLSWYLDDNIESLTTAPQKSTVNKNDEGFMESNKMHAINGFVYRNLPGLTMCKGDGIQCLKHIFPRSFGMKKEVEEFALLFMIFDENESCKKVEDSHAATERTIPLFIQLMSLRTRQFDPPLSFQGDATKSL
ncbi:ferroxidase HEPHL1-like [Cyclopterus lumpus]|uniref:ferroxidase HEPHL1-like n=1 Tax=Cyclopterus lumpus TaxID=8103 RepID=UPI001486EFF9|nr:ferroxidase HEPHL1-like [Cyclopterus lumpus]